ncbi:MAG: hypothetical protein R8G66_22315 [Cytophagales bacterium]|nr:hypothetical protein [Cytophagales bacterium]
MKNLKLSLILFAFMVVASAVQAQELPKSGIVIKLDSYELDLTSGSAETKVYLLRSKRLRKVKTELAVQKNDDLNITLEPIAAEADAYTLRVEATSTTTGNYTLMIDGAGRWKNSIRSTTFTVTSNSGQQVSTNGQ